MRVDDVFISTIECDFQNSDRFATLAAKMVTHTFEYFSLQAMKGAQKQGRARVHSIA
ncbi:hypothetical protein [Pseudomonas sp. MPR-ANC1]|uniref:hypothetical protein n=1 Tax=Pseudomonas sp. MPR-ANC1 TaxID=2075548 RepID=UPI001304843A|nr:hypothetical protein [Pseudomonas sp. MPR-ANC1]